MYNIYKYNLPGIICVSICIQDNQIYRTLVCTALYIRVAVLKFFYLGHRCYIKHICEVSSQNI